MRGVVMSESDQPHSRQEEPDDPAETLVALPRIALRLRGTALGQPRFGSHVFVPSVLTR